MTRTWWENEAIIRQLREWLSQTADEVESLPDVTSAEETGPPSDNGRTDPALQPDAGWSSEDGPAVGLLQLVEAFTALRHELKLQTKGTRNLEESVTRSLGGLETAMRTFQSVQAREQQAAQRAARPLVEALAGLDEGLARAAQAFQATHRRMTRSAPEHLQAELDRDFQEQSWWRRLLNRRWHRRVRDAATRLLAESTAEEFSSLMEGFQLIQTRLQQALDDHGIRRLDETGVRVDPRQMTVVELVPDGTAPPETVVEVVRPGYVWGELVVRFAEVRAVASAGRLPHEDADR